MPSHDVTGMNVDELLAGPYKETVATLKANADVQAAIAKYKDENEEYGFLIDDIFLLRYAISHTDDVPHAVKAIVDTLEWRHENQSMLRPYHIAVDPATGKEVRRDPMDIARNPKLFRDWSQHLPGFNDFGLYNVAGVHGTNVQGGPVFYVRPGVTNTKEAERSTTDENIRYFFIFTKEHSYALCDHVTRTTRHLAKATAVIDVKGLSFGTLPSSHFRKMQNETSHLTELYYPQFIGKMLMVNIPSMLRVVLGGFLLLMPKALREKMVFAAPPPIDHVAAVLSKKSGTTADPAPQEVVPLADGSVDSHIFDTFHGIPYESLPSFLGGPCRCGKPRLNHLTGEPMFDEAALDKHGQTVGWCVDGVPNNLKNPIPKINNETTADA